MNMRRRLEQLEQKAPVVVVRPKGLTGEDFVHYICDHIDHAAQAGLHGPTLQRLVSACVDLFAPGELAFIEAMGEEMKAAGLCDDAYRPTALLLGD